VSVFRNLIWDSGLSPHPYDEPVFLRALPGGDSDDDGESWEALYLHGIMDQALTDCFRFLNDQFAGARLDARTEVPVELESRLRGSQVRTTEGADELQRLIAKAIEARIDHAEEEWRKVDPRIDGVRELVERHAESVARIQASVNSLPREWAEFVRRVVTSNEQLVDPKVTAVKHYESAQHDLTQQVEAYEAGSRDIQRQVETDLERIKARREQLSLLDDNLNRLMDRLGKAGASIGKKQEAVLSRVDQRREEAQQQIERVSQRLTEAQEELHGLQGELDTLRVRRRELASKLDEIERCRRELEREQRELELEEKKLESAQKALVEQGNTLRRLEAKVQAERKSHEAKRSRIADRIATATQQLQQQQSEHSQELEQLESELQQIRDRRAAVRELYSKASMLLADLRRPARKAPVTGPAQVRVRGQVAKEILEKIRRSLAPERPDEGRSAS